MSENSGRSHVDAILDTMSDHRRRHLFAKMQTSDKDVFALDELVETLLNDEESPEIPEDQRERVKIDLHHRHLPKMDDAGLIEYDSRNGDVRYRGHAYSDIIDVSQLLDAAKEPTGAIDQ